MIRVLLLVLAALLSLSVKLCAQTNPVPAAQKTEVPSFSPEKSTCPPKCEGPVTASGPEVRLSEILVSTKGVEEGTEAWAQLQGKAEGILVSLRAGFRWRQLPFPVPELSPTVPSDTINAALSERAVSVGMGFALAHGRATVDLAVEGGTRTAGTLSEHFTTFLVGLSIFP